MLFQAVLVGSRAAAHFLPSFRSSSEYDLICNVTFAYTFLRGLSRNSVSKLDVFYYSAGELGRFGVVKVRLRNDSLS